VPAIVTGISLTPDMMRKYTGAQFGMEVNRQKDLVKHAIGRHVAAYIEDQHCNGKGGLDNLHQEVDADRIKAEFSFCIFAHVYKHRLQT